MDLLEHLTKANVGTGDSGNYGQRADEVPKSKHHIRFHGRAKH